MGRISRYRSTATGIRLLLCVFGVGALICEIVGAQPVLEITVDRDVLRVVPGADSGSAAETTMPRWEFDPSGPSSPVTFGSESVSATGVPPIPVESLTVVSALSPESEYASLSFFEGTTQQGDLVVIDAPTVEIAADSLAFSSIIFTGEDLTIAGEVIGAVWLLSGDLRLSETGVVRGDVVVVNGSVRQAGAAKIYGGVFAPGGYRKRHLRASRAWEWEDKGFAWRPTFSYDRVDGARPGLRLRWARGLLAPQFRAWGGYSFASERGQFAASLIQRLSGVHDISVQAGWQDRTVSEDTLIVGGAENTALALLGGRDYRDHFGTSGGWFGVSATLARRHIVSVVYSRETYRAMTASRRLWSVPNNGFRENFQTLVDEKRLVPDSVFERDNASLRLHYRLQATDKGDRPDGPNATGWLELELTGRGLGGDFDYDRLRSGATFWWDAFDAHRLLIGGWLVLSRRVLPPNKRAFVGGLGTLRGYRHKKFSGIDGFAANVEYRFRYWRSRYTDGSIILFFDLGRVSSGQPLDIGDQLLSSAGVALDFGEYARVNLARGLDRTGRAWLVTVRLQRAFR